LKPDGTAVVSDSTAVDHDSTAVDSDGTAANSDSTAVGVNGTRVTNKSRGNYVYRIDGIYKKNLDQVDFIFNILEREV
jgi:hypothetical protein